VKVKDCRKVGSEPVYGERALNKVRRCWNAASAEFTEGAVVCVGGCSRVKNSACWAKCGI
jgi:hypothetical protein